MNGNFIRTDDDIHYAVRKWCTNQYEAEKIFGHISHWNTTSVSNMSRLFYEQSSFNDDISNWDTRQVTNMQSMFHGASSFNQPLSGWNVGQVTNMQSMFHGASSFNQPLSGWDVGQVTNMQNMFHGASSFNQPLSGWDVGQVTDMQSMFMGASSFDQPLSGWDVGRVKGMGCLFMGAKSFNQPLSGWNVGQVTNMISMFWGASSFNQPLSGWNVGQVTNMHSMFHGASSFNQPLSGWNVGQVTNMSLMFLGATSFNQPLSGWNVGQVKKMGFMFMGAKSFNQPLSEWNVSQVVTMQGMFAKATSFNQPLLTWIVNGVINFRGFIAGAVSFDPTFVPSVWSRWISSLLIDDRDVKQFIKDFVGNLVIDDADTLGIGTRLLIFVALGEAYSYFEEGLLAYLLVSNKVDADLCWRLLMSLRLELGITDTSEILTDASLQRLEGILVQISKPLGFSPLVSDLNRIYEYMSGCALVTARQSRDVAWMRSRLYFLGDGGAGKTSLFRALTGQAADEEHQSTMGGAHEEVCMLHHQRPQTPQNPKTLEELGLAVERSSRIKWQKRGIAVTSGGELQRAHQIELKQQLTVMMQQVATSKPISAASKEDETVGMDPSPAVNAHGICGEVSNNLGFDVPDTSPTLTKAPMEEASPPPPPSMPLAASVADIMPQVQDLGTLRISNSHKQSKPPTVVAASEILDVMDDEDPSILFSVWDFGGQRSFRSFQHLFFSRYGVYVVVFDLSLSKDSVENSKDAIVDAVLEWVGMIDVYASEAPWVLVGTHKDDPCCTMEYLRAVSSVLGNRLKQEYERLWDRLIRYVAKEDADKNPVEMFCFWPVYCFHSEGSNIEQLRQVLHQAAWDDPKKYVHVRVPKAYLRTYDRILAMAKERHYLNVKDVQLQSGEVSVEMLHCEEVSLSDDEPLIWDHLNVKDVQLQSGEVSVEMLYFEEVSLSGDEPLINMKELVRFYDQLGLCLHFEVASLANVVVINPQWLVNSFVQIIRDIHLHPLAQDSEIMRRYPISWKKLYTQGVLRKKVLSMLWRGQSAQQQLWLVKTMVKLKLMVRLSSLKTSLGKEKRYFLPSMLVAAYHDKVTPTCSDAERAALTTCTVRLAQKVHPGFVDLMLLQMVWDHMKCYQTIDPVFVYHQQYGCYCARLLLDTTVTASIPMAAERRKKKEKEKETEKGQGKEREKHHIIPGPGMVWCLMCLSAEKQTLYFRCPADIKTYLESMIDMVLKSLSYEHQFEVYHYPTVIVDDINDIDERTMLLLDATRTDEHFDDVQLDATVTQSLEDCLRPKLELLEIEPIVIGAYIRSLQVAGYRDATVWSRLNQARRLLGDDNFRFYLFTLGIDHRCSQEKILRALVATEGDVAGHVGEPTRESVYVMVRGTLNPPPFEVRVIVASLVDTRIYCQPPDAMLFRRQCSIPNHNIAVVHITSEVTERLADHTPVRESAGAFGKKLAAQARSNGGDPNEDPVEQLVADLSRSSSRTAGTTAAATSQGVACVVVNLSDSYDLGKALSQAGVPYVICWTTKVNAYASVLFAKEFYHFCRVNPQDYRNSYERALERLRLSNVVFGNPDDRLALQAARRYERNPSVLVAGMPKLLVGQEGMASHLELLLLRTYHMVGSMTTNELKVPNFFLVLPYRIWENLDTVSTAVASTSKRSILSRLWHGPKEMVSEELIIVFLCPVDGRPVPYNAQPGLRFTVPQEWVQRAYSTLQIIRKEFPLAFGLSALLLNAALSKVAGVGVADVFPPEVMVGMQGMTELSTFYRSYAEETMRDIGTHVDMETIASSMSVHGRAVSGRAYRQFEALLQVARFDDTKLPMQRARHPVTGEVRWIAERNLQGDEAIL